MIFSTFFNHKIYFLSILLNIFLLKKSQESRQLDMSQFCDNIYFSDFLFFEQNLSISAKKIFRNFSYFFQILYYITTITIFYVCENTGKVTHATFP